MLLKNYLLHDSENNDKIKLKFLNMPLFSSGEGKLELKSKMKVVSDFIEFFKQNRELKVDQEFKDGISYDQFDKVLDTYKYNGTSDNTKKLKQAFTDPNKPEKVSINLIKRNINLLAPEYFYKDTVVTKEEIDDRLSRVDRKIKKTLQKISNYLKKQRIDTMTFFENDDGVLSEDKFNKGVMH